TEFRWTPSVRNAHRHPRSFRAYFFDQFKRGRRTAAAYRGIDRTLTKFQIAKNIIKRTLPTVRNGWRWMEPEYKLRYLISAPSIPLANTCYVLGALTAGKAEQPKFYRKTSRPRIIGLLVFRNEDQYLE